MIYLLFVLCVAPSFTAVQLSSINTDLISHISRTADEIHHFIFFNATVTEQVRTYLDQSYSNHHIALYNYNCQTSPRQECQTINSLILYFNRIKIPFNHRDPGVTDIVTWICSRIQAQPILVLDYNHLEDLTRQHFDIICYCTNPQPADPDQGRIFKALNKAYVALNFCTINNAELMSNLSLKPSNLTHMKGSPLQRNQFIHPNRYDLWESFIKGAYFSRLVRAQQLLPKRFNLNQKNISCYVLVCDYSYKCDKTWSSLVQMQQQVLQSQQFELRLLIPGERQYEIFNLYYHVKIYLEQLPALLYIKLTKSEDGAVHLGKFIKYIGKELQFEDFILFRNQVQENKIMPFKLSQGIIKNNGFVGKGSEKRIQKVSADTVVTTIDSRKGDYVLLVTALGIGCQECENFYKQYKQIASLMSETNIVFGLLDVTKNEVTSQQINALPQVLFYAIQSDKPVIMNGRYSFDVLLKWVKEQRGQQEQQL